MFHYRQYRQFINIYEHIMNRAEISFMNTHMHFFHIFSVASPAGDQCIICFAAGKKSEKDGSREKILFRGNS